jgi:hypothetical protein
MKLIIEQDDSKPHYKHQKGFTYQLNNGPVRRAAKSSVIGQAVRLVVRLCSLGEEVPSWREQ